MRFGAFAQQVTPGAVIWANQLTMTVLMTPDMAHFAGNVHDGLILKLLGQVAYACAARYAADPSRKEGACLTRNACSGTMAHALRDSWRPGVR